MFDILVLCRSVCRATTGLTAPRKSTSASPSRARMGAPALILSTRTSAHAPGEPKVCAYINNRHTHTHFFHSFLFLTISSIWLQVFTVRSTWTTAAPPPRPSPTSPSASTTAAAWTAWAATSACARRATSASAARGTSTSVCRTPATPAARTTAYSSPTATAASVAPDTQVPSEVHNRPRGLSERSDRNPTFELFDSVLTNIFSERFQASVATKCLTVARADPARTEGPAPWPVTPRTASSANALK